MNSHITDEHDTVTFDIPGKVSGRKMDEEPGRVTLDLLIHVHHFATLRGVEVAREIRSVSGSDIPFDWLTDKIQDLIREKLR